MLPVSRRADFLSQGRRAIGQRGDEGEEDGDDVTHRRRVRHVPSSRERAESLPTAPVEIRQLHQVLN